jgi:DNA-binding Xre family transcriptional regulator
MGRIVLKVRQARLNLAQRLGRDVSVQEVSNAIGITRAALHKIESDESFLSRPVLAKLCEYYKLQPGDLLKFEDRRARLLAAAQNSTNNRAEVEATGMAPTVPALQAQL